MKRKAFVIHTGASNPSVEALNQVLDKGWKVINVYPSQGSEHAYWLVITQEAIGGGAAKESEE
jgi:hypothetical protein